ncbi:S-adenosyl-L-methionine-dependent methyltransferase [Venustampulla echinocandica]|uniref:S-adenosyl-L-methionine-dependent methyltransferase n=1 Tax=Venustampulla echinocandica TaxID=2656787 RepID=A0A370U2U7_9HELO|nr:S-adenosyl-L-methionine-dependent methyltransferase [Venustampulla echinocandica]RDL42108.1 S-adenosyl-L-methionine-dependent methyltransferase [Venustampulla echinocandica]
MDPSISAAQAGGDAPPPRDAFPPGEATKGKPTMVTIDELADMLEKGSLYDHPEGMKTDSSTTLVKAYMLKNEPEFGRLMEFRVRGWVENKAMGDAFFKRQRERADTADEEGENKFYNMMLQIADEMHEMTGAFDLTAHDEEGIKVLDICMAPGGYTRAVLKKHKMAKCYAITLHPKDGGHIIRMHTKLLAGLRFADVTMLKNEFWDDRQIPATHPSPSSFIGLRPFKHDQFDLVFCDGMVLRTQNRPSWREENEAKRLSCSQLLLSLKRVVSGGTIIMLLHKIDAWPSTQILYVFSKFAKVEVFKPVKKHGTRSSFYMIAKDVQADSEAALTAIEDWKQDWWKATFGGPGGTGEVAEDTPESEVLKVLEEFGPRLIEMGQPLWKIQADALSKTDYAGTGSAAGEWAGPSTPRRPSDSKNWKENIRPMSPSSSE